LEHARLADHLLAECGHFFAAAARVEAVRRAAPAFDTPLPIFDNGHMAGKSPYDISYDPATKKQLRAIDSKYHSLIREQIEEQLLFEPDKETRNRKPLRQPAPFEATWELRFGPGNRFRVLYGIEQQHREVQIQAIGVKEGNRLIVGGAEVEL
jgi:mRNA-degrading endonuclease RelE of RelBE toxin-antitoxin system